MHFHNEAEQLILALSNRFPNHDLAMFHGACKGEFDGYSFSFNYDEVLKAMFIKACLCPITALPNPDQALITILEATYEWASLLGGSFGLNEDDGFIYYCSRLDFSVSPNPLDKDHLVNIVHRIIGALDWAVGALGLSNEENQPQ
jgi:hypothetical protein